MSDYTPQTSELTWQKAWEDSKLFEVEFNEAFIVASSNDTEAKINRVSGKITTNNGTTGTCALLNKTKF